MLFLAKEVLPNEIERMTWIEGLYQQQGPVRNTHRLGMLTSLSLSLFSFLMLLFMCACVFHEGELQWDYCHELLIMAQEIEDLCGMPHPSLPFDMHACIDLNRAIYEHVKRPSFPGEPDTYRSRQYSIDRVQKTWHVDELE
jgi:hypothetical protein